MSEVEEPLNSEIDQPPLEAREDDLTLSSNGSSIAGVVFNFTNSIIGAGIIGLGGAIASSGGLISIIAILLFAFLTKLSLDLVIEMSIGSSYEDLGRRCYGTLGWSGVLISKMMYSFGCLVAYIVVVKDNCGSALGHLISVDVDDTLLTLSLCTFVMLPLCLLRDMTPLSILSLGSVASAIS
jgi:solute carrier family 38 (sodium-coupled neutral amino acid transporter), member 11